MAHEGQNKTDLSTVRNKIVTAQFECYQKITKDMLLNRRGRTSRSHDWPSTGKGVKKKITVALKSGVWKTGCTITFSPLRSEKQNNNSKRCVQFTTCTVIKLLHLE